MGGQRVLSQLARVLRHYRPKIVHFHYTGFLSLYPWLARLLSAGLENSLRGRDAKSGNIGKCWMQSTVQGRASATRAANDQSSGWMVPDTARRSCDPVR